MTNLAINLKEAVAQFPQRVAIRVGEATLTYTQLDDLSARVAGHLRGQGLEPGDRVGVMLPNVSAFPIIYYGILRAGLTVVPMNPLLKAREVAHYAADSGARRIFAWHTCATEAEAGTHGTAARVTAVTETFAQVILDWSPSTEYASRADDDTAVILYTSGTTGTPKGAELTHANLRANAATTAGQLLDVTEEDVIMGCLPLFHAFGQTCALNAAILCGAAISLLPRFDPVSALTIIEADGVTIFEGVPTMFVALLDAGPEQSDTSSLRVCISGGAALPVEVLRGFEDAFHAPVLEGYGLSETSPVASFNRRGQSRAGSIGLPIDGVEMQVVDPTTHAELPPGEVGEIAIRGHNIMRGYWNRPEATAESIHDGWFYSGDMGRQDEDGFFYIAGRKKELIIRGGFNVYPREIEEVLYEHESVLEAAVIGVPHPTHGEEVAAAIVLREGHLVSAEEVREYVKAQVAPYKYPRLVWLADHLPKGPTGKILKRDITLPEDLHV